MNHLEGTKVLLTTPPVASVNNASALTTTIDTAGFDQATIHACIGVADAALTALKVQESDYANMSGAADVTGLVYGTSTDIAGATSALPASTNDNTVFTFDIDLKARKRYLDVVATVGAAGTTGAFITCLTILSRAEQTPTTATQRGVVNVLRV